MLQVDGQGRWLKQITSREREELANYILHNDAWFFSRETGWWGRSENGSLNFAITFVDLDSFNEVVQLQLLPIDWMLPRCVEYVLDMLYYRTSYATRSKIEELAKMSGCLSNNGSHLIVRLMNIGKQTSS